MKARVLVADDSRLVRAVLAEQLTAAGCTVLQAADGAQALEICRRDQPDIVLLDVDMPVSDGHQALVALRDDPATRDIPVVFLTGRVHVEDAVQGLALGAYDYLRKPVEPIELMARLSAALRLAELQNQLRRRNVELSENVVELETVNTKLLDANRLSADLMAMLSHDLRQPLSTIMGYTEMLVTDWTGVSDEQKRRAIMRAHAAAHQLDRLVSDVLIMAQADTGSMPTQRLPVAIGQALTDAIATLSVGPDDLNISVAKCPPALADPVHLRQILTNLVGNAIKYGDPPVHVDCRAGDGTIEIRVADHGEGVPANFVPRVFDRFTRAATGTATTRKGTGLGLYIVRQLAQANGGSVRYEPHEPRGACFIVLLPAAPDGDHGPGRTP